MSADNTVFLSSRIVAATVFSDAAHVTRRATLPASGGSQRLILEGLPAGLDPATMRASTSLGLVRSIETDVIAKERQDSSETAEIEAMIEALEARTRQIQGDIAAIEGEIALIDQVAPAPGAASGAQGIPPLRPDVFIAGLEVLTARRKDAVTALREAQADLKSNEDDLRAARERLARTGSTHASGDKHAVLVLAVETPSRGDCTIDLTYEAAWATWRPYYHIRLQPKENTLECIRFADVWQETREDWSEVKLRLSTAAPEAGLRLPAVLPWTLGVAKGFEDKLGELYAERRRRAPASAKPKPTGSPRAQQAPAPFRGPPGAPPPPPASIVVSRSGMVTPTASYTTAELEAPKEPHVITLIDGLPAGEAAGGGDAFQEYTRQFEEEGEFAEITASGVMTMRPGPRDGNAVPELGAAAADDKSFAADARPLPSSQRARAPASDHPDFVRLSQSTSPKDAAGGIDHEFEVGGSTTLRSGKERNRLSFGSVPYPAKIEYLLRPGVKDHAFGRVTVVNNENVPLLEGPAAIFVGDAFFGETRIRTTPAGGKLILDLGAETAIKSARRTKTSVRTEGILTREDVHVVEVVIEIENHTGLVADLEVQDQVPVSLDPKVKVRLMRTSPKDAELDELTGILTFHVRVAPGARTEVTLFYEIEAPKDYHFKQMLKE